MPVFMKLGDIKGESRFADMTDLIEVSAVDHEISTEFDRSTSKLGTTRRMNPLVVTKRTDATSVAILEAYATGKAFPTFDLLFYEFVNDVLTKVMQLSLEGATIVAHRLEVANRQYSENAELPPLERIAFAYTRVVWTDSKGKTATIR